MITAKMFMGDNAPSMPPGIHEAVEFTAAYFEMDDIILVFEGTEGKLKNRLFQPTGDYTFGDETPEDALERKRFENLRLITQLMVATLDEAVVEAFEAETYEDYVKGAITLLGRPIHKKVNIKVVPRKADQPYTKLPDLRYPKTPAVVERWVEGTKPSLSFTDKELELVEEWRKEHQD